MFLNGKYEDAIMATDFYKVGHISQYPEWTQKIYSNLTARNNAHSNLPDDDGKIVFFGLQGFMQKYLIEMWNDTFFNVPKEHVIEKYKIIVGGGLGLDKISVNHIESLHRLGYLPILIKALPEGTLVPCGIPMLTIENTHKDFAWVTNYLETLISACLWKPATSATTAHWYKKLFDRYAEKTGSPEKFTMWQGHDFSFRGMSGYHDAAESGAGHLLSFYGTDNIPAMNYLYSLYAGGEELILGGSVPATEHSVMCVGTKDGEKETYERLLHEVYPTGIVSIVSDTWDFWHVIGTLSVELKDIIMSRDGKCVFRPDSGNPVKILCGDTEGKTEIERKGAVEALWDIYGGTITKTGHKLLDSHVGLIYGDSITPERAQQILEILDLKGFASANVVFGIGSYTYQYVTRDTYSFAVKSTYAVVNDVAIDIEKNPKTDSKKKSLCGLLRVEYKGDELVVCERNSRLRHESGLLTTVFLNGEITKKQTLSEIRKRVAQ